MPDRQEQRDILTAELRSHELAMAQLTAELRQRSDCHPAATIDPERIYMSAQILRHQIAMALLVSRLSPRATRS